MDDRSSGWNIQESELRDVSALSLLWVYFGGSNPLMMMFAVLRFVGMGTRNKPLYIFGGVSLAVLIGAKQLGSIKGAKKRLGQ